MAHEPRRAVTQVDGLVVETSDLCKSYKRGQIKAVDELNLQVQAKTVHGFLGPNGSGKTTTLRMLLGLIRPDSGQAHIFGEPIPHALPEIINRIGAIVETPKFFPPFSARKNLQILAEGVGVPKIRVDEVLERVGMSPRAKDPFKGYSLGMKQRVAVAATLLKDPELLIFDEPTNGLDPAGIHEIRQTMRQLADEGKTVIVSSHILAEVQQIADTCTIIGNGRVLAAGEVSELLAGEASTCLIRPTDPILARQVLTEAGFTVTDTEIGQLRISAIDRPMNLVEISHRLGLANVWLTEMVEDRPSLEQVFLRLTAEAQLSGEAA